MTRQIDLFARHQEGERPSGRTRAPRKAPGRPAAPPVAPDPAGPSRFRETTTDPKAALRARLEAAARERVKGGHHHGHEEGQHEEGSQGHHREEAEGDAQAKGEEVMGSGEGSTRRASGSAPLVAGAPSAVICPDGILAGDER